MISVRPDPAHPRGGYAELTLSDSDLAGEQTQVSVFDNYSERYLGEAGWQATKVMFGPYAVRREDGQARLVIGPEIVNQIEEYANVKLTVGEAAQDVSWPDEVVPAPGAAKIGGIMGTSLKDATPKSALSAKMPDPKPEPVQAAPVERPVISDPLPEPQHEPVETPAVKKSGRGPMIGVLLLLALLAAGAAFWFLNKEAPAPETVAEPVVAPAPVADTSDPCAMDQLGALDGFAAQAAALRSCGGKASADTALGLVERATAEENAEALLLFGTIYDSQATDPVIEDQIGLTFGDVPATAAEYYARAKAAGAPEAAERLAELCARMTDMTDTLVRGAVADYCGN